MDAEAHDAFIVGIPGVRIALALLHPHGGILELAAIQQHLVNLGVGEQLAGRRKQDEFPVGIDEDHIVAGQALLLAPHIERFRRLEIEAQQARHAEGKDAVDDGHRPHAEKDLIRPCPAKTRGMERFRYLHRADRDPRRRIVDNQFVRVVFLDEQRELAPVGRQLGR